MIRQCCKCGTILGEKEPLDNKEITHGLCPFCLFEYAAELWALGMISDEDYGRGSCEPLIMSF